MATTRVHQAGGAGGFGGKWQRTLEQGGMEPEQAAEIVLRGVDRKRFLVFTGALPYFLYCFRRLSPALYRRILVLATRIYSRGGGAS